MLRYRPLRTRPARAPHSALQTPLMLGGLALLGCLERPVEKITPTTNNVFLRPIITESIKAIDLLFVIDNSASMADKQKLLRDAVPLMVTRLVTPDCVSAEDRKRGDGMNCASYGADYAPEFNAVDDIHIGVITSSIGGFGASECGNAADAPQKLDKARLIPKVRSEVPGTGEPVPDPSGKGFLTWNGSKGEATAGAALDALVGDFALHVAAAGEEGCGLEAPLEAWYRFLVDPSPPAELTLQPVGENSIAVSSGPDQAILAQRGEFLRPDSLVAIVVLTDENDCSAMEGGSFYDHAGNGWLVAESGKSSFFAPASTTCESNPNDRCCHSCLLPAPAGCEDSCDRDGTPHLTLEEDRANVRCFEQKRRFGIDLLYPPERYVKGLSQTRIVDSQTGQEAPNPLLAARRPDLVFFAGIIGVPWQDIATDETRSDPQRLSYMSAKQLAQPDPGLSLDRWQVILGEPGLAWSSPACKGPAPHPDCGLVPIQPSDPFMIESIQPRAGQNPVTGDAIVAQGSAGWSPINGHEYDNGDPTGSGTLANDDLQYSCIFPLGAATKVDCGSSGSSCDCSDEPSKGRPLCKADERADAAADTTQRYGKAYPASRILQVLKDFGENSIVASICPKVLDQDSPDFGYNPAVNAIVDRLSEKLTGQCLPRPLDVQDGHVPCQVIEASFEAVACSTRPGRIPVSEQVTATVRKQLAASGFCVASDIGVSSEKLCGNVTACAIRELEDDARKECFGPRAAALQDPGFCYIDPAKGPEAGGFAGPTGGCLPDDENTWSTCTNPHINGCGATERRLLRFVGQETPAPDAITLVACAGEQATENGTLPPLPARENAN